LVLKVAQDYPGNTDVVCDITETYRWLEDHKDRPELGRCISKYNREKLFLNVDDPKLDMRTWHCADQLFFDINDSKDQFGVKRFLLPFSGLLQRAGVEQVISPPCPSLPKSSAETQLFMLRSSFDKMRRHKSLTDVVLTTEDGANIAAHRVLLATSSDYFKDMFCGSYTESQAASPDDPIHVPVKDCSVSYLECALGKQAELKNRTCPG
jgi:sacsin